LFESVKSDIHKEDWRILGEKMVIAIKRKEHTALSTKIVDGKYFLKGHLNLQVSSFAQAPTPPQKLKVFCPFSFTKEAKSEGL